MVSDKLIGIREETKNALNDLKKYPRETYDDVISELIKKEKGQV